MSKSWDPVFRPRPALNLSWFRARSSAGEHYVDIVGVTGSIPVAPTILIRLNQRLFFSGSVVLERHRRYVARSAFAGRLGQGVKPANDTTRQRNIQPLGRIVQKCRID